MLRPYISPRPMFLHRMRTGTTIIELLLFVAIIAVLAVTILPLLFSATENRLLQQTEATVEENGVHLLQAIGYHVHHAERIIAPALHGSGSIITLQTSSGALNPTIIGLSSGSLILVQHTTRQALSSSQVAVESFMVDNTSTSASRGSVRVRFRLSRTIRLQAPRKYIQSFEAVFNAYPDDVLQGDACHCASAGCGNASLYVWDVCIAGTCETAQTALQCP